MDKPLTLGSGASWLADGAPRVLVVVRDARLRAAVDAALRAQGLQVLHCPSVSSVSGSISGVPGEVVLLDWSMTDGLLSEDRRSEMGQLCRQAPVVLLVPERWMRLVTAEELGVARLLPKTSGIASLLEALDSAAGVRADG